MSMAHQEKEDADEHHRCLAGLLILGDDVHPQDHLEECPGAFRSARKVVEVMFQNTDGRGASEDDPTEPGHKQSNIGEHTHTRTYTEARVEKTARSISMKSMNMESIEKML